jgi:hypothetical protein
LSSLKMLLISAVDLGSPAAVITSSLGVPRGVTGTPRLAHNGPPGAIVAEAAVANFAFVPAYVLSVALGAVRALR